MEMEPTKWWRVVAPDGSTWCETSDLTEAYEAFRPGDRLERLYEETKYEWRQEDQHMKHIAWVRIEIVGWHDVTTIHMKVSKSELRFIHELSRQSNENGGECAPVINVYCGGSYTVEKMRMVGTGFYYERCGKVPGHEGVCRERQDG